MAVPGLGWAADTGRDSPLVLRRKPRHPSPRFAPFPFHTETGSYGAGTCQVGDPEFIAEAVAGGARLIDTSPDYRNGELERWAGHALERSPAPVFVMTQLPVAAWEARNKTVAFDRALRQSLGRLKRRRIEALLIRNAEPQQLQDAAFRSFASSAKKRGLVGMIGACGHGPDIEAVLEHALDDTLFDIILFGAHLARHQQMPELLRHARARGLLLVAMKSREAALYARIPGWEHERQRRRHTPWNGRWNPAFVGDALRWTLETTGADNAVLSTHRREDVAAVLNRS